VLAQRDRLHLPQRLRDDLNAAAAPQGNQTPYVKSQTGQAKSERVVITANHGSERTQECQ